MPRRRNDNARSPAEYPLFARPSAAVLMRHRVTMWSRCRLSATISSLFNVSSTMDTLMRNLKVLPLCGILISGVAATAEAQGSWDGRGYYFNVGFGGQAQDETLSGASTFDIYGETGAVASAQSIGGGPFLDIAGGRRVWGNFGLGLAYTSIQTDGRAAVSVLVPHTILRHQPRETSTTIRNHEHSQGAVHVQVSWIMPITNEFKLMFMAGPSFFSARQEVA